ncbi:TrbI/VirB10 family protein [Brevundimonas naejangsanensis]|uniref:TrbI/VirB10 family protein n=3 Tax=Brevundimonas TaxID=41275 RepID=UPI003CFF0AAE
MSDLHSRGAGDPSVAPKGAAPDLDGRAPRPPVVRLRSSMVKLVVGGAGLVLAGALTWAFVVQPELRDASRARAADVRDDETRRAVRPAEQVTDQPATYDRLPPPRGEAAARSVESPVRSYDRPQPTSGGYREPMRQRSPGPDARELAVRSGLMFETGGANRPLPVAAFVQPTQTVSADLGRAAGGEVYNRHALTAPVSPFELKAGTLMPAVLLTGVDTSRPGPVIAALTQNLYDTVAGRHLLAPQGSRLIGRHEGESAYGDRRAFIVWERLILPNGKSLVLEAEPGVDARGAVGVQGRVDRRLGALVIGTLFAGAVTTLGQMARDEGGRGGGSFLGDAGDAAAIEGSRVGGRLIDRELEVRPVVRVQAGGRVQVMITRDLILEPYR